MTYQNEAGEYLMTAAEMRFEAALDEQSAHERDYDYDGAYDDGGPYDYDYDDCDHTDAAHQIGMLSDTIEAWECDLCYTQFELPHECGTWCPEHS